MDMKAPDPKKDRKQAKTIQAGLQGRRSFEWPLLIYPVLFLTTLGVLYVVNRSIRQEAPMLPSRPSVTETPAVSDPGATPSPDRVPEMATVRSTRLAAGLAPRPRESAHGPGATGGPAPRDERTAGSPSHASALAAQMRQAVAEGQLQGPAKTAAFLCIAVDDKNHARIKQCLAELVAMGDTAVDPLNDLMAREDGETALWAATALARIGTPMATTALLDRLAQTKEGTYKEELSKRISDITNHDSWPLLLDAMVRTDDTAVARAAGASLANMADTPVLDAVIARYGEATTQAELLRLADFVRNVRSPEATQSLLSLAGSASAPAQDLLQDAAIEALARVGNAQAVNYLLRRLEASAPGEDGRIFSTITQIDTPQAQDALLYAAAGSKEVSAEHGRTAAIYALKNYPDAKTVALLERIVAQEQNEKVVAAATRTLDEIKQGPHVTAKAETLLQSEEMLPLQPIMK